MLFMCQGRPKAGVSVEDQERAVRLFQGWKPPADLKIHAHYASANGGDYVIVETDSVPALIEAIQVWAPMLTYEVTPIVPVEAGVTGLVRACETRSQLL
jgi:hypothetical protein